MWVLVSDGRKQSHLYFRDRIDYARRDYIGLLRQYGEQHPNKSKQVQQAILAIQQDPEYIQAEKTSRVFSERRKNRSV
ncbi:MAG: hypothetical protein MJZ64_07210 [Paludibacteraceae bacterium]|nr:hypothetical protein [Paludibacteraceae bacterium]